MDKFSGGDQISSPSTTANSELDWVGGDTAPGGGHSLVPMSDDGMGTPFGNPLILHHLLELCPLPLLSKLRLVSKTWHDLSLAIFRSSITLTVQRNRGDRIISVIGGNSRTPFSQFLEFVRDPVNNCHSKPYRKATLRYWIFYQGNQKAQQFWNLMGNNLTTLDLFQCQFVDPEQFRNIIYKFTPNLQNLSLHFRRYRLNPPLANVMKPEATESTQRAHTQLRSLSINCWTDLAVDRPPISWLELLTHYQSLTSLKVKIGLSHILGLSDGDSEDLMNAINFVQQRGRGKLPLKDLHIGPAVLTPDPASHRKFVLAKDLGLPLKSALIRVDPDMDGDAFNNVLSLHAGKIEQINVVPFENERPVLFRWRWPCLVNLENLRELRLEYLLYESSEIFKYAPNLVRLTMWLDSKVELSRPYNPSWNLELAGTQLVKLTYLIVYLADDNLLNEEDIETLARMTPNLISLDMALNDRLFAIVCQHWRYLEVLKVGGSHLTDEGITGVSLLQRGEMESGYRDELAAVTFPNITNLKELRSFGFGSDLVTVYSVFHGFLHLPELHELLPSFPSTWRRSLGQEALSALQQRNISLE